MWISRKILFFRFYYGRLSLTNADLTKYNAPELLIRIPACIWHLLFD